MRTTRIQQGNKIVKASKRVGRGTGSGLGGKAGRGQKGQQSRTGAVIKASAEGGQTSFLMKIPKLKGFKPLAKKTMVAVNLYQLEESFGDNEEVTTITLLEKGLLKSGKQQVKLLATGDIKKKLTVTVAAASQSAKKKIEAAGGTLAIKA